ncbi:MAG: tetratricopeptide repeat protein [Alphaproteobacteria bacterium]
MKIRSVEILEEELKNFLSNPQTTNNLGKALKKANTILEVKKDSSFANYTVGLSQLIEAKTLSEKPDYTPVINKFKRIIDRDPNFVEAYLMLAEIYQEIDRNKEYDLLHEANKKFPDHYLIMFKLANLMCFKTGEKEKGLELFARCVQKLPLVDAAWAGLGSAYLITRDFEMALKSFETSLSINPENLSSILGVGVYHFEHGNFDEARKYYKKALEIDKDSFWGNFNLGLLDLLENDYESGLKTYEKRNKKQYVEKYGGWKYQEITKDELEKDSNKKILVLREQGFGDDVMYSRYLKPLSELGYKVTFGCSPELKEFFALFPELDDVIIDNNIPETDFSYRTFLMSLPWILSKFNKIKINSPLKFDSDRFKKNKRKIPEKLKNIFNSKKIKVGIAWSGRPTHMRDFCRNIKVESLGKIFENKDIDFFVLQKIYKEEDAKYLEKFENVYNLSDDLKDFMDTATFLDKMDVVFTVDTSLVHIAATMGIETYLFIPLVPDYRWGLKDSQDWYPSLKLLRQKSRDDWTNPLKMGNEILKKLLSSRS